MVIAMEVEFIKSLSDEHKLEIFELLTKLPRSTRVRFWALLF